MQDFFTHRTLKQFFGYVGVGLLNTALNFFLINFMIVLTGVTSGGLFLLFSFGSFCIVVAHSFVWNRYRIFVRDNPRELHREYIAFFAISGATALLSLGILHVLVDIVGTPRSVSPHLWANLALVVAIPLSIVGNFLGYKFLVFKERV